MPTPDPVRPDERSILLAHLDAQRRHVLAAIDGLTDDQLSRPVLPSGWSILGLLRHLTLGLEDYWFVTVMAGGPSGADAEDESGHDAADDDESGHDDADWRVPPDMCAADVIAAYRAAIAASDAAIAGLTLDDAPARPEPWWGEYGMAFPDLRSVVLHVLVDLATHAGHLDAVRELIDGRQHLVL